MKKKLDQVEKRVFDNESHSRQRNLRIYGFNKEEVKKLGDDGLKKTILDFFITGLQIPSDKVNQIMSLVDTYHWTIDGAIIIAFCRRDDKAYVRSMRKNLKDYKPNGKPISMGDDLTTVQQAIRKECQAKFKAMKEQPEKFKDVKHFSYNKIVANGVVKLYSEW